MHDYPLFTINVSLQPFTIVKPLDLWRTLLIVLTLHRAGVNNMEIRVRIGYVIVISTYIATEMSILFGCRPFHKNWQISPDPGSMPAPIRVPRTREES